VLRDNIISFIERGVIPSRAAIHAAAGSTDLKAKDLKRCVPLYFCLAESHLKILGYSHNIAITPELLFSAKDHFKYETYLRYDDGGLGV